MQEVPGSLNDRFIDTASLDFGVYPETPKRQRWGRRSVWLWVAIIVVASLAFAASRALANNSPGGIYTGLVCQEIWQLKALVEHSEIATGISHEQFVGTMSATSPDGSSVCLKDVYISFTSVELLNQTIAGPQGLFRPVKITVVNQDYQALLQGNITFIFFIYYGVVRVEGEEV